MSSTENFYLFLVASLMLNLTPGNDMLYVISRTLSSGIKGGIFSVIGVCLGCLFHIVFAVVGLSALIMKFSIAYDIIRYTGTAYLIYLGITSLFNKNKLLAVESRNQKPASSILITQGIITNVLNPKVALFFIAFLPQFINPNSEQTWAQLLGLGLWFDVQGCLLLVVIVVSVGKANILLKNTSFWSYQKKITGLILIGLGLNMALKGKK